jgi:hypothetical protein
VARVEAFLQAFHMSTIMHDQKENYGWTSNQLQIPLQHASIFQGACKNSYRFGIH